METHQIIFAILIGIIIALARIAYVYKKQRNMYKRSFGGWYSKYQESQKELALAEEKIKKLAKGVKLRKVGRKTRVVKKN